MATSISFDGNDLQTSTIITSEINHESIPQKDAKLYALAHANKSVIPFVSYPSRRIIVSGKVLASSISALDTALDTFRAYFRETDANLDIGYGGGTRRYTATVNGLTIDRPGGLQFANFTIEFLCTQPFGQATSTTSALSASARTSGSYTDAHTFVGTAPYQLPVWTITVNSITDGDNYMFVGNSANGQGITITGVTFAAADEVVIDCLNRTVKVNDVEVDFFGAFPEFEPGDQNLLYSDNFTARNIDIDVDYYPLYL